MKNTITTALLLAGFIGVLGALGPALDAQPERTEHKDSFTQVAATRCGNGNWSVDDRGEIVCNVRKALNMKRVKL